MLRTIFHHTRWLASLLSALLLVLSCATPPDRVAAVRPEDEPPPVEDVVPAPTEEPREEDVYDAVIAALRDGNPYEARSLLDTLGPPPDFAELWLGYGHLLLSFGDLDGARSVYAAVAEHAGPFETDALYVLALTSDDPAESEAYLNAVLEVEPDHAGAAAALGTIALAARRVSEAEAFFETALETNPEHFESLVGMSRIYADRPPRRVALEYLDRALELDPEAGFVHAERGSVLSILRRVDEAVEAYRTALALEPDSPWHHYDLGRVLQQAGRHEEALDHLSEAIGLNDQVFLFFYYRANSLYALGLHADADADYAHVLSVEPGYRDAFAPYAATAFLTGDFARAARYFERTFDELHRVPSFAMLTGIALRQDGRRDASNRWFEQVRRLSGSAESLYARIAGEYMQPRNDDLTIRRIQGERDASVRARMSFYLGALYAMLGREALSGALLESVREADIQGSIEYELAGWFLDSLGRGHAR